MNKLNAKEVFRRAFVKCVRSIQTPKFPGYSCFIQNLLCYILGNSVTFHFDKNLDCFVVKEGTATKAFSDMFRGYLFYSEGICTRGRNIFESYCLDNVDFRDDDLVIDCGANYGDLFIKLSEYIKSENYWAFEPGPNEVKALKENVSGAKIFEKGLSNKNGVSQFFISSRSGDSSVIEPNFFTRQIKINTITLDSLVKDYSIDKCKLLKLEAEGFEPEILQGATLFLKRCEYVAVDGGPERGKDPNPTLPTISNILSEKGFKMIAINGAAHRALFKRND